MWASVSQFNTGDDHRDKIVGLETPLRPQSPPKVSIEREAPLAGSPDILLLPQIGHDDLPSKITEYEPNVQKGISTIRSVGTTTPQALKSILSPKAKFQDRKKPDYNFKDMMDSVSNFTKTVDAGSPKNFRIKSRASIIKETSPAHNSSWQSDHDPIEDLKNHMDEQKSYSHNPYHQLQSKDKALTESSEKMQSKSDRTVDPRLPASENVIKTPKESKKSSAIAQPKNSSSKRARLGQSQSNCQAIGGVEAFARIVMPAERSRKHAEIHDSLSDTTVCKFIDRLSKTMSEYHPVASRLKELLKGRVVQVEEREVKDFVPWSEIFAAYFDPNRKIKLVASDKYC